ncbi:unnamed protein product, partial [Owenia fusiformis]
CIGTETEDGNVEEQRFGSSKAQICGRMTSIECEEVLPTTTTTTTTTTPPSPSTTTTTTTTTPLPTTSPSIQSLSATTQTVLKFPPDNFDDQKICMDIIFLIDASCTVAKKYQRDAVKIIKSFISEIKFKSDMIKFKRIPMTDKKSYDKEGVDKITDQQSLSNVAVIPFQDIILNTTIPFQNNRKYLQKGLKQLLKHGRRTCKTFGDSAYNKATYFFNTIPKRDRNIVVVFGDGRNTGTKHQLLSEQAMERLKSEQNVDVIWIKTPTKILNRSKTELEQAAEIVRGQLHIERHVDGTQIFDVNDDNLHTNLMEYFYKFYGCEV